jgi:N-acetylmuramoyl-L-alanine amidase
MATYGVKQGECFATIAMEHGLTTKTLYEHPDNAELRKIRPNRNVLYPGDSVAVPERRTKDASVETGAKHRFRLALPKRELRLILRDHAGKAIAGEPYVLETESERIEGQTTGAGEIKQAVAGGAQKATLTIRGRAFALDYGYINPLRDTADEGMSGARERLRNLGYVVGDESDPLGPCTRTALALFQSDAELEVTGELDDATRAKLLAAHGC